MKRLIMLLAVCFVVLMAPSAFAEDTYEDLGLAIETPDGWDSEFEREYEDEDVGVKAEAMFKFEKEDVAMIYGLVFDGEDEENIANTYVFAIKKCDEMGVPATDVMENDEDNLKTVGVVGQNDEAVCMVGKSETPKGKTLVSMVYMMKASAEEMEKLKLKGI